MDYRAPEPLLVVGPCAAETPEQLLDVGRFLAEHGGISYLRAGVWKPRTRPGRFEGHGEQALPWLAQVQERYGIPVCVEVARPEHVRLARAHGIRTFWIGARTAGDPFAVQEIADALVAGDGPFLVKNPISPDTDLWVGAIERLRQRQLAPVIAVHRGFYPLTPERYRNSPRWDIVLDLRSRLSGIPILCDPSHIAGRRSLVPEVARRALDLSLDGLMVEVHQMPEQALSDAGQQLSFSEFTRMMQTLRCPVRPPSGVEEGLRHLRAEIDTLDEQILALIARRMRVVEAIGRWKCERNIVPYRRDRWCELLAQNRSLGARHGLSESFVEELYRLVHAEALRIQAQMRQEDG
ncbi:MAG: 3-deoxy-7-phosphoheptulonate synthase [Bacteroidia bacterium]|nr:MAG: 3-deoxy-7-phosphoheptulonate synthase [Bacteroidia bacterium]